MGLSSSGDEFCRKTDKAIEGLSNVHKLVDDVLIEGSSEDELAENVVEFLQKARASDISVSNVKTQVGSWVHFGGFVIDACYN